MRWEGPPFVIVKNIIIVTFVCVYAMLHSSEKLPITLNKCPYYAQTLLIKWLMYYSLDFAING